MNTKLIYDIGMYLGQDTRFYLQNGFDVLAVDASPKMIDKASETFSKEIADKRLTILNYVISTVPGEQMDFYISEMADWSSLRFEVATREDVSCRKVQVESCTLPLLFEKYGVPYYCKIDIEGYDEYAVRSMKGCHEIPKYISCESESLGDKEIFTEEQALATLYALHETGYTKFKLVDQETLKVLDRNTFYLNDNRASFIFKIVRKLFHFGNYKLAKYTTREKLSIKYRFNFDYYSSGPFGEMIDGKWFNFTEAKDLLLFHREQFFKQNVQMKLYSLWCDWHATY
jgi:FkbM family methyltransferase